MTDHQIGKHVLAIACSGNKTALMQIKEDISAKSIFIILVISLLPAI